MLRPGALQGATACAAAAAAPYSRDAAAGRWNRYV